MCAVCASSKFHKIQDSPVKKEYKEASLTCESYFSRAFVDNTKQIERSAINCDAFFFSRKDKKVGKKNKKRRSDSTDGKPSKDQPGIKFPDIKGAGAFLRSSKVSIIMLLARLHRVFFFSSLPT